MKEEILRGTINYIAPEVLIFVPHDPRRPVCTMHAPFHYKCVLTLVFCLKLWLGEPQIHGNKCDTFSLGCVLFFLLCGEHPFIPSADYHHMELPDFVVCVREKILAGQYDFEGSAWSNVSREAKDLCDKLLEKDASLRLDASQVRLHPWIKRRHMALCSHGLSSISAMRLGPAEHMKIIKRSSTAK